MRGKALAAAPLFWGINTCNLAIFAFFKKTLLFFRPFRGKLLVFAPPGYALGYGDTAIHRTANI